MRPSICSSNSYLNFSLVDANERRSSRESRNGRACDTPNFIVKNIRAASRVRKIEYDTDESEVSSLRCSIGSRRCSGKGSKAKEPLAETVDLDYSRGNSVELEEKLLGVSKQSLRFPETRGEKCRFIRDEKAHSYSSSPSETSRLNTIRLLTNKIIKPLWPGSTSHSDVKSSKYYIKQSTCPACMEKWKKPLPPPKTPKANNAKVVPTLCNQLVKTDSRVRVKELIHKEKHTLETYDRKFSSTSESSRRSSLKREDVENDPCDFDNRSPLELARIRQENREKETKKKLEKFLNSPI